MVKRCAWGTCNSDSRYPDRTQGVSFHPFPKPKRKRERCMVWIRRCNRPSHQLNIGNINKHKYVCSKHFVDGKPSSVYPDPIQATANGEKQIPTPVRSPPKKRPRTAPLPKRRKLTLPEPQEAAKDLQPTQSTSEGNRECDTSNVCEDAGALDMLALAAENRKLEQELANQILQNEELKRQIQHDKAPSKAEADSRAVNIWDIVLNQFTYYTGFTHDMFTNIVHFLVQDKTEVPLQLTRTVSAAGHMSYEDQILLTIIKLRLNFDFKHLATLFSLSPQDCSSVFRNWINFMFYRFGSVPIWPHRDVIISKMPPKYLESFPNCMVIIDGTEIKLQRPAALNRQSQCYSEYKSCTTLKGLVGVDPRGSVIFSSMLFSGSISDKEICEKSGFFQILKSMLDYGYLKKGDGVMGDKGFTINSEIEALGLKLYIPPFAPGCGQMAAADVALTKKIATHRVHVERAISRIKKFKI